MQDLYVCCTLTMLFISFATRRNGLNGLLLHLPTMSPTCHPPSAPRPGNFIVTPPSTVAVISGPEGSRMVIGECSFQRWFIGKNAGDVRYMMSVPRFFLGGGVLRRSRADASRHGIGRTLAAWLEQMLQRPLLSPCPQTSQNELVFGVGAHWSAVFEVSNWFLGRSQHSLRFPK